MSKPVLAAGLLVVMAAAWHVALRPRGGPPISLARAQPPMITSGPLAVPTVRLDQLAAHGSAGPAPGEWRNPFSTGVATSAASSTPGAADGSTRPVPTGVTAPVVPAWPRVELIGVAEARDGSGLVRTAIISGPHGVHHARPGDVIEQVYRVERIGGAVVELQLLPEGRTLRLALRP